MDDTAIKVDDISKVFKLPHEKQSSIKGLFVNLFRGRRTYESQKVLDGITFNIKTGEFFGIVGRNGSGKSTLLKLLAGIYSPTSGAININGSLTPFIELGVGFNPELTGRENVYLNGALLGFNRNEMDKLYPDIVEFAELEKFMDQKLKNYSSGMQVRLAFSIAIRAKSDILLIDEVLAVGDAIFQQKCYDYFKELKRQHKTVVLVSHDSNILREYCTQGVFIQDGKIANSGKITEVVNDYIDSLNESEEESSEVSNEVHKKRWGEGSISVKGIQVLNSSQKPIKSVLANSDTNFYIKVNYEANKDVTSPVYGITITDSLGQSAFTSNTKWSEIKTKDVTKGQTSVVQWKIPNAFNVGTYMIAPAVADSNANVMFDWIQDAATFKVRKNLTSSSYINLPHEIIIES